MKSILPAVSLATLFILTSCNSNEQSTQSADKENSSTTIKITDAWARHSPKEANSAAYLTIFNGTATADTLLNIQTDAAKLAAIHESYRNENGMTGMRPARTIVIQPDSGFVLEPGGFHIMLMQLNRELVEGDSLQLTLNFAVADTFSIVVPVGKSN